MEKFTKHSIQWFYNLLSDKIIFGKSIKKLRSKIGRVG